MSTTSKAVNLTYRNINSLQRVILAVGSGIGSFLDPSRDDMISTFGETTAFPSVIRKIKENMLNDAEGQQILAERPLISTKNVNLQELSKLPKETFGKHYVEMLGRYEISPDTRKPVYFIEDEESAYIIQRYRQIHDFTHCILGMPTTMLGEVTVKWFEGIQYNLPMCWTGGFFGAFRLGPKHSQHYLKYYLPWIIENGLNARKQLINVYFEKRFEQPIDDIRKELNLTPPPPSPVDLKSL